MIYFSKNYGTDILIKTILLIIFMLILVFIANILDGKL
jgi:hypothetical protein